MSNREIAINLINEVPENKLLEIISYLKSTIVSSNMCTPNLETIEAINELENGGGFSFSGNTNDLFKELEK